MTIYMYCDGIKGDVSSVQYQNWIQLKKLQFHLESPVCTRVGDAVDRIKGQPFVGEIQLLKSNDSSSLSLMNYLLSGVSIRTVKIHLCHSGSDLKPYEQYELSNVLVSSFLELKSEHVNQPLELIRLNFTKLEKTHIRYAKDGQAGAPERVGYDLKTAQIC